MNLVIAANQAGAGDRMQVLPMWSTFIILIVVVVELMAAGFFLKKKWLETREALPIPAALAMMFLMVALYVLVGSTLYWSSTGHDRPQILFWLFLFYIPLVIQYGMNIVNAITLRATLRISPVGVEIPDSPVLAQAQKLLMSDKIDEAVALFTNYYERRTPALVEVARLLKANDKLAEATAIYVELVDSHTSDRVAWPEAVYTLAKIYETQPEKAPSAIALYRRLLDEAPDSRFTHLAGADLARLMIMDVSFIKTLNKNDDTTIPEDPFFAQRRNFLLQRMKQRELEEQNGDRKTDEKATVDVAPKKDVKEAAVAPARKKKTIAKKKTAAEKAEKKKPSKPAKKTAKKQKTTDKETEQTLP